MMSGGGQEDSGEMRCAKRLLVIISARAWGGGAREAKSWKFAGCIIFWPCLICGEVFFLYDCYCLTATIEFGVVGHFITFQYFLSFPEDKNVSDNSCPQ